MKFQFCILLVLHLLAKNNGATFSCDFDVDQCGFVRDYSVPLDWERENARQGLNTGPDADLTGNGYFWFMDADFSSNGDVARSTTPELPGGNCSTVSFYYYMYGEDIGGINVYLTQTSAPYYSDNTIWSLSGNQDAEWKFTEFEISFPTNFTLTFEGEARFAISIDNKGDLGIDNVTVSLGTCDYQHCDPQANWCQNGGFCFTDNSTYICECTPGWHGPHCELDVDECASSPCNNGSCMHGLNSYQCFCFTGYHGVNCEFINQCVSNDLDRCGDGGICNAYENDFNCTCLSGFSGQFCETNINDCLPGTCVNNGVCSDLVDDFKCDCPAEYVGKQCEFVVGGCDFDDGNEVCGYVVDKTVDFLWMLQSGTTPNFNTGPNQDHTTGEGNYMFADAIFRIRGEVAVMYSPMLPDTAQKSCTIVTFWYWMEGDSSIGTLSLYISTTGNHNSGSIPMWSKKGPQGTGWQQAQVNISAEDTYSLIFEVTAVTTIIYNGDIAVDDITVSPDSCKYNHCNVNPCKNGGFCVEDEEQNFICVCTDQWTGTTCTVDIDQCLSDPCQNNGQCVDGYQSFTCTCVNGYQGRYCEYYPGGCDFEDLQNPLCLYVNDPTADFSWTRLNGSTPTFGTGPTFDHTTGTVMGFYLYSEATDTIKGQKARVKSPLVLGSGGSCSQLSFWYHMFGNSIGQLALYLDYGEILTNPVWSDERGGRNQWVNAVLNISIPRDYAIVFEAVMEAQSIITVDNQGDIAIDDIVVTPNVQCDYDICFTQPCLNGGTCVAESETDYGCICTPNWSGGNCDHYKQCDPNPCKNNGVCVIGGDGNFECLCDPQWLGNTCQMYNFCASNPCLNGATCTSSTQFECACPIGYEGLYCDVNPDDCADKPCKNGGSCTDGLDDFTCDCLEPYFGKDCTKLPSSCDLETGLCGWENYPKSEFSWDRRSGAGWNYPLSGPRTDHTYQNRDKGYYTYTPLYRHNPTDGQIYRIRSPLISFDQFGPNIHFELYYHMSGSGIGVFRIYMEENGLETKIFEQTGDQQDNWLYFGYDIAVKNDWRIIVEHEVVQTLLLLGDIAIDDMKFSVIEPVTTTPPTTIPTTKITTQPPATTKKTTTAPVTDKTTKTPETDKTTKTPETEKTTKAPDKTTTKTTTTSVSIFTSSVGAELPSADEELSGGAIAGIVIGILVSVALIVGIVLRLSWVPNNDAERLPMSTDFGITTKPSSSKPGYSNPSYEL